MGNGLSGYKITGSVNQPAVWRADLCFIEFGMIKVDKWELIKLLPELVCDFGIILVERA